MADAEFHVARVRALWPDLCASALTSIGDGWTCDTYDVDGRWIVKFPRTEYAEEMLRKQSALLPRLAGRLPVAIPTPVPSSDPEAGFLWGMFVSREHRRKQCGERLLKEAEGLLANGGKKVTACVAAPYEIAIRFYQRNGYMIGPVSGTLRTGSSMPIYPIEKQFDGLRRESEEA